MLSILFWELDPYLISYSESRFVIFISGDNTVGDLFLDFIQDLFIVLNVQLVWTFAGD